MILPSPTRGRRRFFNSLRRFLESGNSVSPRGIGFPFPFTKPLSRMLFFFFGSSMADVSAWVSSKNYCSRTILWTPASKIKVAFEVNRTDVTNIIYSFIPVIVTRVFSIFFLVYHMWCSWSTWLLEGVPFWTGFFYLDRLFREKKHFRRRTNIPSSWMLSSSTTNNFK